MYYQVQVSPRDCDSLRFLWWPDGNLESQPVVHRMKVYLFGAISSPCCTRFALRQAAIDFGAQFEPCISFAIEKHFYVDERFKVSKASFKFIKWCSNLKHLLENELLKPLEINALAKNSSERVSHVRNVVFYLRSTPFSTRLDFCAQ